MKCLLVFCTVVAACLADTFPFETIDVEAIVSNPEKMQNLTNCFLDKGECGEAGAFFKKALPDVLANSCANCEPAQKHIMRRYLEEVSKNYPDDLAALIKKYDPEGAKDKLDALKAAIADA